jgi:hypothetical protein
MGSRGQRAIASLGWRGTYDALLGLVSLTCLLRLVGLVWREARRLQTVNAATPMPCDSWARVPFVTRGTGCTSSRDGSSADPDYRVQKLLP